MLVNKIIFFLIVPYRKHTRKQRKQQRSETALPLSPTFQKRKKSFGNNNVGPNRFRTTCSYSI